MDNIHVRIYFRTENVCFEISGGQLKIKIYLVDMVNLHRITTDVDG